MTTKAELIFAEDDSTDADFIIRSIQKSNPYSGFIHFQDGAEILEYVFAEGRYSDRDINETPRIIFLDIKMPKVNGLEVLERIKKDKRTMTIPVVMLTSSQHQTDISASYRLGANSYVVKPIELNSFLNAISELTNYWIMRNQSI
jgi:two-component system response regulator